MNFPAAFLSSSDPFSPSPRSRPRQSPGMSLVMGNWRARRALAVAGFGTPRPGRGERINGATGEGTPYSVPENESSGNSSTEEAEAEAEQERQPVMVRGGCRGGLDVTYFHVDLAEAVGAAVWDARGVQLRCVPRLATRHPTIDQTVCGWTFRPPFESSGPAACTTSAATCTTNAGYNGSTSTTASFKMVQNFSPTPSASSGPSSPTRRVAGLWLALWLVLMAGRERPAVCPLLGVIQPKADTYSGLTAGTVSSLP